MFTIINNDVRMLNFTQFDRLYYILYLFEFYCKLFIKHDRYDIRIFVYSSELSNYDTGFLRLHNLVISVKDKMYDKISSGFYVLPPKEISQKPSVTLLIQRFYK